MRPFFLILLLFLPLCGEEKLQVLVTLAPYQFVVEQVGGDGVEVSVLVPPGVSGHTYEPTAKEMLRVGKAPLWFRMGEPFEEKILPALKAHNPDLQIVDLREGIDLIYDNGGCPHCQGHNAEDLHFWLSPKNLEVQARLIEKHLKALKPDGTFYLSSFLERLAAVEKKVEVLTKEVKPRAVLVSHPAYAYFCREYHFQQLSVEVEGKDPTPKQIVNLVGEAKKLGIRKVFTQPQYGDKGAALVAKELGATLISLDPYGKDVFQSLLEIAREFGN